MAYQLTGDPPSPFVLQWAGNRALRLPPPRRALDIAMGRGRHTRALASLGFTTFGVDINLGALLMAVREVRSLGLTVRVWCADLTISTIPSKRFELIVVTRYLQRDLIGAIRDAVVPDGLVIYETFTVNQRTHGRGPRSPDHLLQAGELEALFQGFEILFYDEVLEPDAVARLVARRPANR